jgi:hypothetical protein
MSVAMIWKQWIAGNQIKVTVSKSVTIPSERSYMKRPEEAKESQLTHGNRKSQPWQEPSQSSKKPAA